MPPLEQSSTAGVTAGPIVVGGDGYIRVGPQPPKECQFVKSAPLKIAKDMTSSRIAKNLRGTDVKIHPNKQALTQCSKGAAANSSTCVQFGGKCSSVGVRDRISRDTVCANAMSAAVSLPVYSWADSENLWSCRARNTSCDVGGNMDSLHRRRVSRRLTCVDCRKRNQLVR